MKIVITLLLITFGLFARTSFLMPDDAFKPSIQKSDETHLQATIELGDKIYIYADKLTVTTDSKNIVISHLTLPQAHDHEGSTIYSTSPSIGIDLEKLNSSNLMTELNITLSFQGCSEAGLCYEPMQKSFIVKIDASKLPLQRASTTPKNSVDVSETDAITQTFIDGNIPLILLTFFTFGLLLALTPCIFPMIPILSSIIVSQGEGMSAKRGFMLSLVYVLSMSFAYTLAGVLAGVFGANIQVAMQNPWVISTFALLFVGLAMSMFGYYEIGLPASIQSKLSRTSDQAGAKGGFVGVAIMGFLSALIVGPCVAPPLAGALVYIGQTGDAILGGAALFVLSIGMGMPLLLIGIGAGKFMPRPGGWMMKVSQVFGVVMLGIAIWMLARIIPETLTMFLWAFLFIGSAIFLGALEPLKHRDHAYNALLKTLGIIILTFGLFLFFGALTGAKNPLNPLEKVTSSSSVATAEAHELKFKKIHSIKELEYELANSNSKKIMLDFYADWCISCKELEHSTFKDPQVIAAMQDYILLQADVTDNTDDEKALTKLFGLYGPPGIIFFDKNAKHIEGKDLIGYKDTKDFLNHIKKLPQ